MGVLQSQWEKYREQIITPGSPSTQEGYILATELAFKSGMIAASGIINEALRTNPEVDVKLLCRAIIGEYLQALVEEMLRHLLPPRQPLPAEKG